MPSGPWLSPSTRGGLQLAVQVTLSVALFAVLQLLATRHNVRFDLTPSQAFVLSDSARRVTQALTKPAQIIGFYNSQESNQRRQTLDLLDQFAMASPNIEYRLHDLDRSPGMARKYGVSSYNTGAIESDGRVIALQTIDEGEITNALLKLSSDRVRTLCFVTGHGERRPEDTDERSGYSEVAKALERENFRLQALVTLPIDGVPSDCTVVVLAGPSHDLVPGEGDVLARHLRQGGRVLMLVDPDAPPSVVEVLRGLGVEVDDTLVVDERNRFVGADSFMPHVVQFRTDTFGNKLDAPAVLALARTIRPSDRPPPGVRVIPIAATSPESWALAGGHAPDENVRFRPDVDHPGPLSVGVLALVSRDGEAEPAAEGAPAGQLIVFGDSDFATNFYLNLLGNKDLFMSTIAVLSEDPELIAVRRKGLLRGSISPISLTAWQGRLIFWVAVVAQPVVCILMGAVVTLVRRKRRGGR